MAQWRGVDALLKMRVCAGGCGECRSLGANARGWTGRPPKGNGGRLLGRRVTGLLDDVDLGWQIARHFETNGLLADLRFVPNLHWEYSSS